MTYEEQYLNLIRKVLDKGEWVSNKRTGVRCLTLIGESLYYDVENGDVPVLNTRQSFPVSAVAEIVGYLRKYTNAQQFADIGSSTWFVNANETQAWLDNPNRKGENDLGVVYGAAQVAGETEKVYNNLRNGVDDRGETLSFWRPELFDKGCLRACMRQHHFSIVGDKLYLNSESRSVDVACGLNFNSIQCYFLLSVMAKITGLNPARVKHDLINVHIYEPHLDGIEELLSRPVNTIKPKFEIQDWVKSLEEITCKENHARDYFKLTGYEHQGKIPFDLIA